MSFVKNMWWESMPVLLYGKDQLFWIIVPQLCIFPMMLAKKIGEVRFLAMFGFGVIIYLAALVVGYSLSPSNNPIDNNLGEITWFQLSGAGSTFAYF